MMPFDYISSFSFSLISCILPHVISLFLAYSPLHFTLLAAVSFDVSIRMPHYLLAESAKYLVRFILFDTIFAVTIDFISLL